MIVTLLNYLRKQNNFNKQSETYNNGEFNNLPEIIDALTQNSSTARYCLNQMVQYLIGRGIGEEDEILINQTQRFFDVIEEIAKSKVKYGGVFLGISYVFDGENYSISEIKVLPYENCRIGKKDDKNYSGKILVYKDLNNKKNSGIWYDVYNNNKDVITSQIKKAGSFEKYKGQILFITEENSKIYPISRITGSAEMDLENEIQIAKYKNQILKNGFFGKTMVLTRPLINKFLPQDIEDEDGKSYINPEYTKAVSEKENFKNTISEFCGSENIGGVLHLEIDFENEDIEKEIKFVNIESKIDPNLFAQIEKITQENICKAFNNFPLGLITHSSGGLNSSGEQIKELKKMYWENTEKERNQLERTINFLWKNHEKFNGKYLKIKPYEFASNEIN